MKISLMFVLVKNVYDVTWQIFYPHPDGSDSSLDLDLVDKENGFRLLNIETTPVRLSCREVDLKYVTICSRIPQ